jgi:hypothetical protein
VVTNFEKKWKYAFANTQRRSWNSKLERPHPPQFGIQSGMIIPIADPSQPSMERQTLRKNAQPYRKHSSQRKVNYPA